MQKDSGKIKTITKAAKVLMAISLGNSRLSDIAREVNISKNGVFRLLHSLKEERMVIQDPITREYFMGPMLFEINVNPLITHEHLISIAYMEIDELKRATGETIVLSIKFGLEQMALRRLIGTYDVAYIGKANPISHLWLGATGKVLMAQLSSNDLDVLINYITLIKATPYSITDKKVFKQEIMKVKEKGYATSFSEDEMGVASIATPISGYISPAALAIIGPNDRLASHIEEYVEALKTTSQKISQQLIRGRE
ncbi:MAG: IclR family transcriptional regulator [Promethearchaeota archaeon]